MSQGERPVSHSSTQSYWQFLKRTFTAPAIWPTAVIIAVGFIFILLGEREKAPMLGHVGSFLIAAVAVHLIYHWFLFEMQRDELQELIQSGVYGLETMGTNLRNAGVKMFYPKEAQYLEQHPIRQKINALRSGGYLICVGRTLCGLLDGCKDDIIYGLRQGVHFVFAMMNPCGTVAELERWQNLVELRDFDFERALAGLGKIEAAANAEPNETPGSIRIFYHDFYLPDTLMWHVPSPESLQVPTLAWTFFFGREAKSKCVFTLFVPDDAFNQLRFDDLTVLKTQWEQEDPAAGPQIGIGLVDRMKRMLMWSSNVYALQQGQLAPLVATRAETRQAQTSRSAQELLDELRNAYNTSPAASSAPTATG